MYIELESVFNREGESVQFNYEFSLDDENITTPVKVEGSVFNRTGIVGLKATAKFDYATQCAKCNKPLLRHATVPIKHTLISYVENEEDRDMYIVVENMRLDLDELVSEEVFLSIPSRFLCKEDCKGLCPFCGTDLNETTCNCSRPTDSRWDALKELFNE